MDYIYGGIVLKKGSLMQPPDQELVEKSKRGDKQAFTALVDRYSGKILGYLYRYMGDYHKAEDMVIETFLSVYNNLSNYEERGLFSSWLFRIATNCAKKELRKKEHQVEVSLDKPLDDGEGTSLADLIADDMHRPDYSARESELKEFVYKAISKLDKKYKDALLLCDVEGMSQAEAAKILGSNPITIGTRLQRARKMLYDILRGYGYVF